MTAKQDSKEVPGNTMASQASFDKYIFDIGKALLRLEQSVNAQEGRGVELTSIKLKYGGADESGWFVIINAMVDDKPVVAFHDGSSLTETLKSLAYRFSGGKLKWKHDEYYKG